MDETLDDWFKREVLVHEASLVRYLNRCWRNRDEVHDLRQEVYIRVYEAAAKARPTSTKSFVFSTARHLMTDRIRRGRIVSIEAVADMDALNVLVDDLSPERRVHARQELSLLARAFVALPRKCREVMWLRRVDQISQKEVASRLRISQSSVEKHVIRGTRLLADAVYGRQLPADAGSGHPQEPLDGTSHSEAQHGKQHRD